jgi:hypothetical protein
LFICQIYEKSLNLQNIFLENFLNSRILYSSNYQEFRKYFRKFHN